MPNALEKIKHIVVLMLENRSFDHMLGFLYRVISMASKACRETKLSQKIHCKIPLSPSVSPILLTISTISILIQDMMCTMSTSNYSTSPKSFTTPPLNRGFVFDYAQQPGDTLRRTISCDASPRTNCLS